MAGVEEGKGGGAHDRQPRPLKLRFSFPRCWAACNICILEVDQRRVDEAPATDDSLLDKLHDAANEAHVNAKRVKNFLHAAAR